MEKGENRQWNLESWISAGKDARKSSPWPTDHDFWRNDGRSSTKNKHGNGFVITKNPSGTVVVKVLITFDASMTGVLCGLCSVASNTREADGSPGRISQHDETTEPSRSFHFPP
jgi:hypothetical protein